MALVPKNDLCDSPTSSPRLSLLALTSDKVAVLEVEYAKESEKLELLRQKIQLAKDEGYLAQRKAETSELALKLASAEEELEQVERRHDSLREDYKRIHLQWQMDRNRVYDQVNYAEDTKSSELLIEALQAQVEVTKEETKLLKMRVEVLRSRAFVEHKEKILNGLINEHRIVTNMENKLAKAKQELSLRESQWEGKWGSCSTTGIQTPTKESGPDARITELTTLLEHANNELEQERKEAEAKITEGIASDIIRTMMEIKPFYEAGVAVHLHRIEHGVNANAPTSGCGGKVSHQGSALVDALLVTSRAELRQHKSWYLIFYGFKPHVVIELKDCPSFLQILDWRGAMMDFNANDYRNSRFHQFFCEAFRSSPVAAYVHSAIATVAFGREDLHKHLTENPVVIYAIKQMDAEYKNTLQKQKAKYLEKKIMKKRARYQ